MNEHNNSNNHNNNNNNNQEFAKILFENAMIGVLFDYDRFISSSHTINPNINRNLNTIELIFSRLNLNPETNSKKLGKYEKIKENDVLLNTECAICLDKYEIGKYKRELKCKHIFHKKCVDKWIKKNENCPVCRKHVY